MQGWRLFAGLAIAETALFAGAMALLGTGEDGLRTLVRLTAMLSFAIFLPVYSASSLRRLFRRPATRWLLRNRRYLGVSFAWAHGLHGLAIVMLWLVMGDAFESSLAVRIFGGAGYLLMFGMAFTSTDRSVRRLGARRWALLHRCGIHLLWLVFTFIWSARAIGNPAYAPFALAAWGAGLLRLGARRSPGDTAIR